MERPDDEFVGRREFDTFQKLLSDQKSRWDRRLDILENEVKGFNKLTTSVEKLALSVERMTKEQERQGERLGKIESKDGEMWRKLIGYILTALASAVMTLIFAKFAH